MVAPLPPAGNSLECDSGSAPIWVRHRAATATFQEEADNPVREPMCLHLYGEFQEEDPGLDKLAAGCNFPCHFSSRLEQFWKNKQTKNPEQRIVIQDHILEEPKLFLCSWVVYGAGRNLSLRRPLELWLRKVPETSNVVQNTEWGSGGNSGCLPQTHEELNLDPWCHRKSQL